LVCRAADKVVSHCLSSMVHVLLARQIVR